MSHDPQMMPVAIDFRLPARGPSLAATARGRMIRGRRARLRAASTLHRIANRLEAVGYAGEPSVS